MEKDRRGYLLTIGRLERAAEHQEESRRDGAEWKELLAHYREVFPEKDIRSTAVKSPRAQSFFLRQDSGATLEDCKLAVTAARKYRWVTFGRRTSTRTDKSILADDIQHIMSIGKDPKGRITGSDHNFEFLVQKGREASELF